MPGRRQCVANSCRLRHRQRREPVSSRFEQGAPAEAKAGTWARIPHSQWTVNEDFLRARTTHLAGASGQQGKPGPGERDDSMNPAPQCSASKIGRKETADPTTWWLAAIGRLNPGWTFQRASAQLASMAPGIFAATLPADYDATARKDYLRFSLKVEPAATGASPLRKQYADPLWVLLSISGLVLLIACANLANLMLARAGARQREIALRLALGASRLRLIRQLPAESLILALGGAAIGIALAQVLGGTLVAYIGNAQDPVFLPLYPDLRVLCFTFGVALLTCVIFGVAPALQASHADPGSVMKASGRGLTAGRERFLLRRGLIVSQVALSLALRGCGSAIRSNIQEPGGSRCRLPAGRCSRRRLRFFVAECAWRKSP